MTPSLVIGIVTFISIIIVSSAGLTVAERAVAQIILTEHDVCKKHNSQTPLVLMIKLHDSKYKLTPPKYHRKWRDPTPDIGRDPEIRHGLKQWNDYE